MKDIIVGVIYRPPNTDFDVFYNNFMDILAKINLEKRPTYLLGDFNIDLLKYGKVPKTQKFLNLLLSNGFYPGMLTRPEGPRPGPARLRPRPGPLRPRPRPEQWTLKAESRPTRSRTSSINIDYCFLKLL